LAYPEYPDVQPTNFPWQLIWVPDTYLQAAFPLKFPYSTAEGYFDQMLPPLFNTRKGGQRAYGLWAVDKPREQVRNTASSAAHKWLSEGKGRCSGGATAVDVFSSLALLSD
jgi:hypothetical protein